MAASDNLKQITIHVPVDMLARVDDAARQIRGRRNDRTQWILGAIADKLDGSPSDPRMAAIVGAYESMSEQGRSWLYQAAIMARDAEAFK